MKKIKVRSTETIDIISKAGIVKSNLIFTLESINYTEADIINFGYEVSYEDAEGNISNMGYEYDSYVISDEWSSIESSTMKDAFIEVVSKTFLEMFTKTKFYGLESFEIV